ncbi:MAG: dihydrodipicolinate synthase family protein [Thermomicrobiales bacterium]
MTQGLDLHGIIPPVCTPFSDDGQVDVADLKSLIGFLLDSGVHGLFMLGSTSETVALTDGQQETILSTAIETNHGRVPIIAGSIDFTAQRVIERAKRAEALGADGHVVCPPFYIKPDPEEIIRHFSMIREAINKPIIAYDIPGAIQTKLDRKTVRSLVERGLIAGLKDSSGQDANFRGVILDNADHPDFRIFTGSELIVDAALSWGAHGAVPGLGNVDPAGYVAIYDAFRRGDLATMKAEQERVFRLFAITSVAAKPGIGWSAQAWGGFKLALELRGIMKHFRPVPPMTSLTDEDRDGIRAILVETGLLEDVIAL